jgi:hypothetical protein
VLDSEGFADGRTALRAMAGAQPGGALLADLAWTRLTRWREAVARVFEDRGALARLHEIARVRVACGGVAAWYMGAWILNALADAGAQAELTVAPGEPSHVELGGVKVARPGAPPRGDYMAMREELGITGSDAVFERALASAARLAYSTDR